MRNDRVEVYILYTIIIVITIRIVIVPGHIIFSDIILIRFLRRTVGQVFPVLKFKEGIIDGKV